MTSYYIYLFLGICAATTHFSLPTTTHLTEIILVAVLLSRTKRNDERTRVSRLYRIRNWFMKSDVRVICARKQRHWFGLIYTRIYIVWCAFSATLNIPDDVEYPRRKSERSSNQSWVSASMSFRLLGQIEAIQSSSICDPSVCKCIRQTAAISWLWTIWSCVRRNGNHKKRPTIGCYQTPSPVVSKSAHTFSLSLTWVTWFIVLRRALVPSDKNVYDCMHIYDNPFYPVQIID